MWLYEADGFTEFFKGYLPYYLLVALPIFIIMSPVNPVAASHEFSVYRMQQYDLASVTYGCHGASINLEGRSYISWSTSRHCVVAQILDISIEQFMEIRSKAGALLLVLPENSDSLSDEETEHIQLLEMAMLQRDINSPVYFVQWSAEMASILDDLEHSFVTDDKSGTALEAMFNTVSSNGYQIVVSASNPQKLDSKPTVLHGKLAGRSGSAPSIVIAAHYGANAIAPELAFGADSNASGAVALIELARIFSRLYSNAASRGAPSIIFLLSSVGHTLNFFDTKRWLDEQAYSTENPILQAVSFVMCLDSILSSPNMTMHVSKPPKPGTASYSINARLGVPFNHKKINLADKALPWQHEQFSIKKMSAFTLSSLQSHKSLARSTVLDTQSDSNLQNLVENIRLTARALASHIYNWTDEHNDEDRFLYDDTLAVDEQAIAQWYRYLSSQPRSPQVVTTTTGGVQGALVRVLSRYLDVTSAPQTVDKVDPEFVLYGPTRAVLYVYSVKPAVFDLILTLVIVAYLSVVYFAIQLFPRFYDEYAKMVTGKTKVQ